MKIIVFGLGNFYHEQKQKLKDFADVKIVAFTDNNQTLWNKRIENVPVISPDTIEKQTYDKILIMSTYVREMYKQLLSLGIPREKILTWEYFWAQSVQGKGRVFGSRTKIENIKGEVLVISTNLNYNGGTLAAVYVAEALSQNGISVILAAPDGNKKFMEEMTENGLTIVLLPSLPYVFDVEKSWIQQFRIVIVNTYQMIECACQVSKFCPTIWWLHEYKKMYAQVSMKYPDCLDRTRLNDISIYTVSNKARDNFNSIYPNRAKEILAYGIPDIENKKVMCCSQNRKFVFAIIGGICSLKSQDIFLDAALKVNNSSDVEFWIIGKSQEDDYCSEIRKKASVISSVRILGELTRSEIYKVFEKIDVVVCSSKEDMLPIVITESMMFGKTCVITDVTGMAEYIQNGVSGFIVPVDNAQVLAEKMQWLVDHKEKADEMGMAARKTYERYFTMDVFAQNLEKALRETIQKWKQGEGNETSMHLCDL